MFIRLQHVFITETIVIRSSQAISSCNDILVTEHDSRIFRINTTRRFRFTRAAVIYGFSCGRNEYNFYPHVQISHSRLNDVHERPRSELQVNLKSYTLVANIIVQLKMIGL